MKTGSKYAGWVLAAAIALSAAAAAAPAATSADFTTAAFLIRLPSTPIVTTVPAGQRRSVRVEDRGAGRPRRPQGQLVACGSGGAIVAGDHFTSHVPWESTRCKADLIVMVPRPASVRRKWQIGERELRGDTFLAAVRGHAREPVAAAQRRGFCQ